MCGAQVVVYHGQTRQTSRTFSRFKDVATSGVFRGDGKLLAAGCLSGTVQVRGAAAVLLAPPGALARPCPGNITECACGARRR